MPRRRLGQEIYPSQNQHQVVVLCILGSRTSVPMSWACKKQTAESQSSSEPEIASRGARIPFQQWICGTQSYKKFQAGSDSKAVHPTHILKHQEPFKLTMYSNWAIIEHANFITHLRRKRSCKKTHKERQKSHGASCITHTSCRFGLAIRPRQSRSDDSDQMCQHNTAIGRHSYKGSWTEDSVPAWKNVPENLSLDRLARGRSQFITQDWSRDI